MPFDEADIIKIVIAVGSVVALYLFRRKINLMLRDFMAGNGSRQEEESSEEILERIEARIMEVIR